MVAVQQQILDNIVSTLETYIDGTGDYTTELARVYVMDASSISGLQLPAVLMLSDSDRVTEQRIGMDVHRLEVTLVLAISGQQDTWDADLREFLSDVQRALTVDHSRGALAIDTSWEESVVFEGADEMPVKQAEAKVSVQYRTAYGDPDTPL